MTVLRGGACVRLVVCIGAGTVSSTRARVNGVETRARPDETREPLGHFTRPIPRDLPTTTTHDTTSGAIPRGAVPHGPLAPQDAASRCGPAGVSR